MHSTDSYAAPLPAPISLHHRAFLLLWLFMIFVSVFDGLLIVVHRESIGEGELNPVGRWLLQTNGGQIWLFVLAKLAATIMVASLVKLLYEHRASWGLPVVSALACFQLGLLLFLCFG